MLTMNSAKNAKMDMAKPVEVPVLSVNLGVCYAKRTIKNALRAKINLILLTREVNVESVPATVSHVTKTFLNVSNVKVDTERMHKKNVRTVKKNVTFVLIIILFVPNAKTMMIMFWTLWENVDFVPTIVPSVIRTFRNVKFVKINSEKQTTNSVIRVNSFVWTALRITLSAHNANPKR